MPLDERISRWRGMYTRLLRHDAAYWRDAFLGRLGAGQKVRQKAALI
jgi:trehalose-6-phosphate synthase